VATASSSGWHQKRPQSWRLKSGRPFGRRSWHRTWTQCNPHKESWTKKLHSTTHAKLDEDPCINNHHHCIRSPHHHGRPERATSMHPIDLGRQTWITRMKQRAEDFNSSLPRHQGRPRAKLQHNSPRRAGAPPRLHGWPGEPLHLGFLASDKDPPPNLY
jgi:hypothetical protein